MIVFVKMPDVWVWYIFRIFYISKQSDYMWSLPEVAHKKAIQKSKIRRMSPQERAKAFGLVQASYERFVFSNSNCYFLLTTFENTVEKNTEQTISIFMTVIMGRKSFFLYRPYKHSKAYKEIP